MIERILVVSAWLVLSLLLATAGQAARSQSSVLQTPAEPEAVQLGPGVTNPRLLKDVRPGYTPEAMRARIEGTVVMEALVLEDGAVGEVRLLKSLDAVHGLDEQALAAARKWLFSPARKDGKPVRVWVTLEMAFRVRAEFGAGAYRLDTPGIVAPKPVTGPNPSYTPAARGAGVQGTVDVEIVVRADGTVADARISRSLDKLHGLDEEALATARRWTFEPATLKGQPVPVVSTLTFQFRLQ
jgi:TonB family protein